MRGKDHIWKIVKYKSNLAYYMQCSCGFEDGCSVDYIDDDGNWCVSDEVFNTYNYCPNCGAKKKWITQVNLIDGSPPWTR